MRLYPSRDRYVAHVSPAGPAPTTAMGAHLLWPLALRARRRSPLAPPPQSSKPPSSSSSLSEDAADGGTSISMNFCNNRAPGRYERYRGTVFIKTNLFLFFFFQIRTRDRRKRSTTMASCLRSREFRWYTHWYVVVEGEPVFFFSSLEKPVNRWGVLLKILYLKYQQLHTHNGTRRKSKDFRQSINKLLFFIQISIKKNIEQKMYFYCILRTVNL